MIITLNNKCNFTKDEFLHYQQNLQKINVRNQLILCPSSCYLSEFNSPNISLGAQNTSSYEEGNYTGEISARQLKSMGVKYCIVGHYERRKYFYETNELINHKIKRLLENNIIPILCIGEEDQNKQIETTMKEIIEKIKESLDTIPKKENVIIAYEPASAIGTEQITNVLEINKIIQKIKEYFPNNKIIYGGGITATNTETLKKITPIDGYLLGTLCLDIDSLKTFLQEIEK